MFDKRLLFSALVAGLAGSVGMGCGGDDEANGGGNGDGLSAALTASATSVRSGDTVELTWTVAGATSVILRQEDSSGEEVLVNLTGADAVSGSQTSNPIGDETTFTLIAENADGREEDSVTVSVQGIRIVEFSASPSSGIRSGDEVELSWVIEGASVESLELTDEDGETPNGPDGNPVDLLVNNAGSVDIVVLGDVGAEDDTETFTLRAVGGGGTATETLELDVEVALPVIDEFTTTQRDESTTYIVGDTIELAWTVRNATRVIIRVDETGCTDNTNFENGVSNRTTCRNSTVREGTQTVTILVGNANTPTVDDFVPDTLTITGVQPPVVDSFTVDPATYWQGLAEVTFTWETSVATSAELQERIDLGAGQREWCTIKEDPDPGCRGFDVTAPTSADGTFTFQVEGAEQRDFRIRAILEDGDGTEITAVTQRLIVQGDFNEPASSLGNPIVIDTDNVGRSVRGTITDPDEEDFFAIDVPEDGRIFALASVERFDFLAGAGSCLSDTGDLGDTNLELFDPAGNSLGSTGVNGFGAFGSMDTQCAVLNGTRTPFAMNLPAGRYVIKVTGDDQRAGRYTLNVQTFEPNELPECSGPLPICADVFQRPGDLGAPLWEIRDINVVSIPLTASTLFWPYQNHQPVSTMNPFVRLSVPYFPLVPHERDYGDEIQPSWQAGGVKLNQAFQTIDLGIDATGDPRFLALTYTVVATSSTGTTFDYRDANGDIGQATGPMLPASIFPLTTDVQQFGKSFGGDDLILNENVNPVTDPAGGNAVDPIGYPADEMVDRLDVADGVSHRHFLHLAGVAIGMNGITIDNPADRYTWVVHIFDDSGAGYELEVSFDVTSTP